MGNSLNRNVKNQQTSRFLAFFKVLFQNETNSQWLQLFRYLIVGGIAFIADFGLLFLLVKFLSVQYLIAAAISFIIGLVVNYFLSIAWVFNKDPNRYKGQNLLIFLFTGLVGLVLNELFMFTFTQSVGLDYLLSKAICVPLVLLWNFFSRKFLLNRIDNEIK